MYIDLLTKIKNAQAVKKENIKTPYSKMDERILESLKKSSYIKDYTKKGRGPKKIFDIKLKYLDGKIGVIQSIKFVSKPSRRVYIGYRELKPVRQGYGLLVISTPQGIMTGKEAKKLKLGGEVLFKIW